MRLCIWLKKVSLHGTDIKNKYIVAKSQASKNQQQASSKNN